MVCRHFVSQETFHYDSDLWSNKETFNVSGGETVFGTQETKLTTYWDTPFTKICLGMKIRGEENISFLVINQAAESLYSLIADGQYRNTSLGRDTWKTLIGRQASLQINCNMKDLMLVVSRILIPRQGSVLLLTSKTTVGLVTPESGLVQEGILTIPTRVETLLLYALTMETEKSQPWGTFLSTKSTSDKKNRFSVKCPINSDVEAECFSIECRKTKTKPITCQSDQPVSNQNQNQNQRHCLITFDTQMKTALY